GGSPPRDANARGECDEHRDPNGQDVVEERKPGYESPRQRDRVMAAHLETDAELDHNTDHEEGDKVSRRRHPPKSPAEPAENREQRKTEVRAVLVQVSLEVPGDRRRPAPPERGLLGRNHEIEEISRVPVGPVE